MAGTITLTILGTPVAFTPRHRVQACLKPGEHHPGPCPGPRLPGLVPKKKAKAKAKPPKARKLTPGQASAMQQQMLQPQPWTRAQRVALYRYSDEGYVAMNGALRGTAKYPDPDPAETKDNIRAAYHGLRPLPESVRVFRTVSAASLLGLDRRPSQRERLDGLRALIGQKLQERGFSSTTIDEVNEKFERYGDVMLDIEVPAGTRAAYIEQITHNDGEHEMVLTPGMTFEFIDLDLTRPGLAVLKVKGTPPS